MVKLYFIAFGDGEVSGCNTEALSPSVREKIEKTTDEKTKRDRIITYLFLEEKIEEMKMELCRASGKRFFSDRFKLEIDFTEKGKPFIKGIDCGISVSHTDGGALVAISLVKFFRIGVDIEKKCEKSAATAEGFIKRRLALGDLPILSFEKTGDFISLESYKFTGGVFEKIPEKYIILNQSSICAIEKWCALEALLKLDGGGFSSLSHLENLKTENDCYSASLKNGDDTYAISVATEKTVCRAEI